jgi:hypothetical protein
MSVTESKARSMWMCTLRKLATAILIVVAIYTSLQTISFIGIAYRGYFGGSLGHALVFLHLMIVGALGVALHFALSGLRRGATLIAMFALTSTLFSTAYLFTPYKVWDRAMSRTSSAESALSDARLADWESEYTKAERELRLGRLSLMLDIRRAEERAATLEFQRAKDVGSYDSLLIVWALIFACFTLLCWWKWRGELGRHGE